MVRASPGVKPSMERGLGSRVDWFAIERVGDAEMEVLLCPVAVETSGEQKAISAHTGASKTE